MNQERCPKCNKILNPQEPVCSSCGAKVKNNDIGRINSIYHSSNVATLIYLAILVIGAFIYGFFNWILAVIVMAVLFAIVIFFKFKK